jgi:lipopolysaccharide/colanic/teichoic acid biosynthesis glycosyltransferase
MAERASRLSAVLVSPKPVLRTPAVSIRPASTRPPEITLIGGLGTRVKGVLDALLAAALLVPGLPLMLACGLLVRLTSAGPALYTQTRVGRGGRVFTLFKIRTMYHECESLTGPRWCLPGDPRITPVGKVLRRLHLDELPQLFNVLRGDMSLVGPRPERPEIVKRLRQLVPGYDRRHAVKPGITGFAQVHLPPDSCVRSVKNKLVYDLFYIRNRSVRMELYIGVVTALKLFGLKRFYQRKPRFPTEE